MRVAQTTVYLEEGSTLRERPFVGEFGDVYAWLDIGDDDVRVCGSPAAMRRLGAAAIATADAADRLAENEQHAQPAARAR